MGDVGGFVGLHHLRESREGTMEEGVKTFSPTRDRTFSSPSVPPSLTKLRATLGGWQPELGGRTRRPDYFLGGHALAVHKSVHSDHLLLGL